MVGRFYLEKSGSHGQYNIWEIVDVQVKLGLVCICELVANDMYPIVGESMATAAFSLNTLDTVFVPVNA